MPVVGHATWHAYRDCVAWEDVAGAVRGGEGPPV